MKTTNYILVNNEGVIIEHHLPFDLKNNSSISELLPVYAYPTSYTHLLDLLIEAYEFSFDEQQFLVDIVMRKEEQNFRIIIDNRTHYYKQKVISQSQSNTAKINAEYIKLNNEFLVSKNKYLDFVVTALHSMVADTNNRINKSLDLLAEVNTFVKDDDTKIKQVVDEIKTEILYLQKSIDHSNILKHLNPSTILNQATYIDLNKLVKKIVTKESIEIQYLDIQIPHGSIIYGNEEFYYELISYYFNLILNSKHKLTIHAGQANEDLMKIQINYFSTVKSLQLPQEFVQVFNVPTNHEIESNSEIIQQVFESLKNALLKQAYFLNQVAA